MRTPRLEELAASIVRRTVAAGATAAECALTESNELEARVRLGAVEAVKDSGSSVIGVRALLGRRAGSAYTSDFSEPGLARMVADAVSLARLATEDPYAGLPEPERLGSCPGDLAMFCPQAAGLDADWCIARAREAEQAALDVDSRLANSEGARFVAYTGTRVFANSLGFAGSYRATRCLLSVTAVAEAGGLRQRDSWYTTARGPAGLEGPEVVGRAAAQRALRRVGARKVATTKAPVVFDPQAARSIARHLFDAVAGEQIYRRASFLAGRLGEPVASEALTLVDDATVAGLLGSSPFDDEGVASARTVVIERGVLKSYLLNSYTARRLGLATTGNAARGVTGNPGTGCGNLFLAAGELPPEDILAGVKSGLYVTELLGTGVNTVNGEYSRGAVGFWIEDGQLAYPVHEITIAGNLRHMLKEVAAAGSDLEFRGSTAAPTLLIGEMTVSGH